MTDKGFDMSKKAATVIAKNLSEWSNKLIQALLCVFVEIKMIM